MAKAVVEAGKMEKVEGGGGPTWLAKSGLADLGGWGPRKFRELKSFFSEVKTELKKVETRLALSSRSKTRSKPTVERNKGEKSNAVLMTISSLSNMK